MGGEASRYTGGEPKWEGGKTIKPWEGRREECISGGKALPVAFTKAMSERRGQEEDRSGGSWSTKEMPWRWCSQAEAWAGQCRMVWLKDSGSSPLRGQSGESPALNQEDWAARYIFWARIWGCRRLP